MTVTVYRSTDASAPTLTGTVGSLIALLDACLVNGYGSQAAAGWTKPFANSANVGCYKNSAVSGTGMCLSVNDAAPGAGGAREARMTGFQTLSSVSAGTGQFPTAGQASFNAVVCRKSATADATARTWTLIADNTVFYLFPESGDFTGPVLCNPFVFGDIFSYASSDPYRCMIIGQSIENTTDAGYMPFATLHQSSSAFLQQTLPSHYLASSWTGVGTSVQFGKHVDHGKLGMFGYAGSYTGNTSLGTTINVSCAGFGCASFNSATMPLNLNYPNPPDGGLYVSPVWIHHGGSIRGYFKGLWAPMHVLPLGHNQTYNGSGTMAGKSLLSMAVVNKIYTSFCPGEIHIETSSTWS